MHHILGGPSCLYHVWHHIRLVCSGLMARAHRPYLISVLNAACDAQHIYPYPQALLHTHAACSTCLLLPSPPPLVLIACEHALSSTPTHQTSLHTPPVRTAACWLHSIFPTQRHKAIRQTSCKSAAGLVQPPRIYFLFSRLVFFFHAVLLPPPPLCQTSWTYSFFASMLTYSTQLHPSGSQGQRSL
jgi:hypothetical protein